MFLWRKIVGEPPLTPAEQRRKLAEMQLRRGQLELELAREMRPRLEEMTKRVASYAESPPGDLVRQWKAYTTIVHDAEATLARYTVGISIVQQASRMEEATTDMQDVLRVLQSVRSQLPKDPKALVEDFRKQTEAMQDTMELMAEMTRDYTVQASASVAVEQKTDPAQLLSADDRRLLTRVRQVTPTVETMPTAKAPAIDEGAISEKMRRLREKSPAPSKVPISSS
jgi:hypothetical protein